MATEQDAAVATSSSESVCSDPGPTSASFTSTIYSTSGNHSRRSSQSSVMDLPPSAFDGSHLHWKTFRQHVLAPHRIRVLDKPPGGHLPETLLTFIEAQSKRIGRFEEQKNCFRAQVSEGRGFGPSPLFPPNLLPSIDDQPQLARCMVPAFRRDALPDRALNQTAPLYELSVPRPGLGCGFSSFAFTNEETAILPTWLIGTGTSVDFSTGFISPSHAVYCPFLLFERAFGSKEHRLEAANNQCAIGGAWSCRALQMLYAKAYNNARIPSMPVTFTCTVDNDFAIVNYHWIDHEQAYHMAPLCKFDLRIDDHFSHFAAWIDAIGQWALACLLPQVKKALEKMHQRDEGPSPGLIEVETAKKLVLATTESNKNEQLIKSLKTTFENIPWRFEDDEFTPVSSSTASWGSPMVDDMIFANLTYPTVARKYQAALANGEDPPPTPRPSLADVRMSMTMSPPLKGTSTPPPPAYTQNLDLVWQKRFEHAMDEIRDLQAQLESVRGTDTAFRKELTGLRTTLGTVLRKESTVARNRSLLAGPPSPRALLPMSPTDDHVMPFSNRINLLKRRNPEMLQIKTDLPTLPHPSNLKQSSAPPATPPPAPTTAPTLTLSCNGVDVVLSPKEIKPTQSFDSHKSPLSVRAPWTPRTPRTPRLPPLPPSPPMTPRAVPIWSRWPSNASPQTRLFLRWASTIVSGYLLVAFVPSSLITWLVVGCAADYCLRTIHDSSVGALGLRAAVNRPGTKVVKINAR